MKTRILRVGKSSVSVLLSILMILSTVLVGSSVTVETQDSATSIGVNKSTATINTHSSGDTDWYMRGTGFNKTNGEAASWTDGIKLTSLNSEGMYYADVTFTSSAEFKIVNHASAWKDSSGNSYTSYGGGAITKTIDNGGRQVTGSSSNATFAKTGTYRIIFQNYNNSVKIWATSIPSKIKLLGKGIKLTENGIDCNWDTANAISLTNTSSPLDCYADIYINATVSERGFQLYNAENENDYQIIKTASNTYLTADDSSTASFWYDSGKKSLARLTNLTTSGYYRVHYNSVGYSVWLTSLTFSNHTITKKTPTGEGTVTVDKTEASYGQTVTVTSTPTTAGHAATVTVNKTNDSNTTVATETTESNGVYTTTFTMPDYAVDVNVTFAEPEKYNLTLSKSGSGTVTGIPYVSQTEGTAITVTSTPSDSSQIAVVDVYKTGDSTTKVTATTKKRSGSYITSFTMPAYDVTVSVTFKTPATYTVTATSSNASVGTATPATSTVTEGNSIVLTASVTNLGYYFSGWTTTASASDYTIVSGSVSSSVIKITPKANVTFKANFAQKGHEPTSLKIKYGDQSVDDYSQFKHEVDVVKDGQVYYCTIDTTNFSHNANYYFALTDKNNDRTPIRSKSSGGVTTVTEGSGLSATSKEINIGDPIYVYAGCSFASGVTSVMITVAADGGWYKFTSNLVSTTTPTKGADEVKVIAKDGTVRDGFEKFVQMADTTILSADGDSVYTWRDYSDRATSAYIAKDAEVVVQTTISGTGKMSVKPNATASAQDVQYRNLYYVKAFVANGVTYPATETPSGSGVYTAAIQLPNDGNDIDITPVYFYKKDTGMDILRFEVEGFVDDVKTAWGGTVACYVYYHNNLSAYDPNNFDDSEKPTMGGFPGQPMVYENGTYIIEFPRYDHAGHIVTGMTLNNYIWDKVYGDVNGKSDSSAREVANHQTYDYDDFAILAKDTSVDTIYFRFKYRTSVYQDDNTKDNGNREGGYKPGSSGTNYASITKNKNYANGWEVYRDHNNNIIDIFNNQLNVTLTDSTKYFYAVSDGYIQSYIGDLATEWSIYDTNGDYVTKLPSSVLFYDYTSHKSDWYSATNDTWTLPSAMPSDFPSGVTTDKRNYWSEYKTLFEKDGALGTPVQLTFESAVYAKATNDKDPAERCDGRWFASRANDSIQSSIKIEYRDSSSSDTWTADTLTLVSGNKYVGTTTKADVAFSDATLTSTLNSNTNTATTSEYNRSSSTRFDFTADTQGGSLNDKSVYHFDGFYRVIDGDYSPLDSTSASGTETGSVDRLTGYDIVARYTKVANSTLTISHKLLKNAPDTTLTDDSGNTLTAGKGSGKTTVKVDILDKDGQEITDSSFNFTKTYAETEDKIEIPSLELLGIKNWYGDDYQIKITLTTTPKNNKHIYTGLYDRVVTETTSGETTTYTSAYYPSKSNTPILGKADNNGEATTSGSSKVITYTLPISDLFDTDGTTLKTYDFKLFSNIDFSKTITLQFKYYDRAEVNNEAATIRNTETTLTYSLKNIGDYSDLKTSIADIVANPEMKTNDSQIYAGDIRNLIDNYVIWTSQTEAISDNGLKKYPYYKIENSAVVETTYGALEDFDTNKVYHTQWNSALNNSGENWVTYYTNGSTNPVEFTGTVDGSEYNDNVDVDSVDTVVVWAFNRPNRYTVTAYTPKTEKTLGAFDDNIGLTPIGSLYYFNVSAPLMYEGFYNQRIGAADTYGATNNGSDNSVYYLNSYFNVENNAAIAYTNEVLDAPQSKTVDTTTYVFDGWYTIAENGTPVKVSSDRIYGNRITCDQTIYAMYKVQDSATESTNGIGVGVTATTNGDNPGDVYVVQNSITADDQTKKVRLNTQLNVYYDIETIDNDDKIEQVAVVYVNLDKSQYSIKNGKVILTADASEAIKAWLTDTAKNDARLGYDSYDSKVRKTGRVDFGDNIRDIVIIDSYLNANSHRYGGEGEPSVPDSAVSLTSKNRAQFVLQMSEDLYDNTYDNLIAFVAIKYDPDGDGQTAPKWLISDNYVSYVND